MSWPGTVVQAKRSLTGSSDHAAPATKASARAIAAASGTRFMDMLPLAGDDAGMIPLPPVSRQRCWSETLGNDAREGAGDRVRSIHEPDAHHLAVAPDLLRAEGAEPLK